MFVEKAAMGGKAEVELGNLALRKASESNVKQFAQKMVDAATQANKLQKTAEQEHILCLPAWIQEQERLSKLSGAEFDGSYMRYKLKDHQKDVAEFQKEASSGQDAAVKEFA